MLTITTDNNSIKVERNGLVLFIAAKNAVSYLYDNARVFLNPPETVRISATFSDGIEMNGTPITPENIEAEFRELFFLDNGGSGGTTDHTQLTNRDVADQHPVGAITGLQDELDGKVNNRLSGGLTPPANRALLVYNGGLAENEDIVGGFSVPTFPTWTDIVFSTPIPSDTAGVETDITSMFTQEQIDAIRLLFVNGSTYFKFIYGNSGQNDSWLNASDRPGYDFYLRDGLDGYDGWYKLYFDLNTPKVLCVIAEASPGYTLARLRYPNASYDTGDQFVRRKDIPAIPMPPATGTFTLQSVDGVLRWV
jgi:hypothetical protein